MRRRFLSFCGLLLAVAMVAGQANASLILNARGPGGSTSAELMPGEEVVLTISMTATSFPTDIDPPEGLFRLTFQGIDLRINSGSTATFEATTVSPPFGTENGGVGGWIAVPPAGQTIRDGAFGAAGQLNISPANATRILGTIVLRAGGDAGQFETFFTNINALDGEFLPIPVTPGTFSYSVVPEPSAALLSMLGLVGLAFRRRQNA